MMGLGGNVQVIVPPVTPCVECRVHDFSNLNGKVSCGGELIAFPRPEIPTISTTNSIIAAI